MSKASAAAGPPVRDAAPLFAALGDETRLRLLIRLSSGGPGSITQLSAKSAVSRQAITKHLRVLEGARIVHSVRAGRESLFELDPAAIRQVGEYAELVSAHWDRALGRLRALVEGDG